MLRNTSTIKGYAIMANDGPLGHVSDFLFDDVNWSVRWLVVDSGNWLFGRKVLLLPSAVKQLDPDAKEIFVELTMQQVKDSPEIGTDLPVSRQTESELFGYYGTSPYWGAGIYTGGYGDANGAVAAAPSPGVGRSEESFDDHRRSEGDPHLRSTEIVTGYHVHATDGEIGHIEDFLVDDADWDIHFLIVDTSNWWSGKKVLISPHTVRKVDWMDRLVDLPVERQRVKDSPAFDTAATVDPAFETYFHDYYRDERPKTAP